MQPGRVLGLWGFAECDALEGLRRAVAGESLRAVGLSGGLDQPCN
jgi:hypothetical protein